MGISSPVIHHAGSADKRGRRRFLGQPFHFSFLGEGWYFAQDVKGDLRGCSVTQGPFSSMHLFPVCPILIQVSGSGRPHLQPISQKKSDLQEIMTSGETPQDKTIRPINQPHLLSGHPIDLHRNQLSWGIYRLNQSSTFSWCPPARWPGPTLFGGQGMEESPSITML